MGACASAGDTSKTVAKQQDNSASADVFKVFGHKDARLPCLLLSGTLTDSAQEAFADKPMQLKGTGLDALADAVGFACQKGMKESAPTAPNQDNFLILKTDRMAIYGVFDGHGPHGQSVSGFVAPAMLHSLAKQSSAKKDPAAALRAAFLAVQQECICQEQQRHLDCTLSGTTATVLIDRWASPCVRQLSIASCGDSRAVLGCEDGGGLVAVELTTDHRPEMESEQARIQAAGGVVRRGNGDPHSRVYVRNKMGPGLAMSRAIGDTVAANIGVICEPDVTVLEVQSSWRFVLVCSDGVWEFVSSQEAVELVGRFKPPDAQHAAAELADVARKRWLGEEITAVDDITVLCVWLV